MRSFRYYLFTVAILSFNTTICYSQDSLLVDHLFERLIPNHAIKISPLHLIGFYSTVQLGYEVKVARRISMQLDAGYVINHRSAYRSDFQDKRGTKLKLEGRYFLDPRWHSGSINYVSVEPYTTIINFDRETAQVECFDLDCQVLYSKRYLYKMKYRESGFSIKYGFLIKSSGNFLFDFNFGWTLRFVRYIKPDLGTPGTFIAGRTDIFFFNFPNEQNRIVPTPVVGLRVGYRIR